VRLARAATGRDVILKFDGCYHGHGDSFLVGAGSGVATLGLSNSPGVPTSLSGLTRIATFNDLAEVEAISAELGDRLAAIIVEPVVGNAGLILPTEDFLPGLRCICDRMGALLIFDEVMTGFRVAMGGATARYGVRPDLVTLGKVIGGGLPVAAYGGSSALMTHVAPEGSVYQAGTLSGNPLAMAAGIATLDALTPEVQASMEERAAELVAGLRDIGMRRGVPLQSQSVGTMWGMFFTDQPVRSYADAKRCDVARFRAFFHAALKRGIYLAPSAFEAGFLSSTHDAGVIGETLTRLDAALADVLAA
jgi:glutamate-1-semialdehyde 2,1-aminomutase